MERERAIILALLDLCAFACSQGGGESARHDFKTACRLAEIYFLPEVKAYKACVASLEQEGAEELNRELEDRTSWPAS